MTHPASNRRSDRSRMVLLGVAATGVVALFVAALPSAGQSGPKPAGPASTASGSAAPAAGMAGTRTSSSSSRRRPF